MPVLNGKTAEWVVKGAIALIGLIILCMTFIIGQGQEIPPEFTTVVTALVSALSGLVIGTRVVPPDVSAQIKKEPITVEEQKVLTHEQEKKDAANG